MLKISVGGRLGRARRPHDAEAEGRPGDRDLPARTGQGRNADVDRLVQDRGAELIAWIRAEIAG